MDIVVVGSVAYDSVTTPYGKAERVLGGSASYFSAAASFFSPVRIVAVVGEDFEQEHLDFFKSKGIDTEGIEKSAGRTFFWEGEYGQALNEAVTRDTQLNVFADFKPTLPEAYRKAGAVFLANIDPDLQRQVTDQVKSPKFIAADTMNFWIQGKRDSLIDTLSRVDILLINDTEAKMLAEKENLVDAAEVIRGFGPKILVIKRGEYGAMLFEGKGMFCAPAMPLASLCDPTGCGDSFAGGFIGYLARQGDLSAQNLRRAMIVGSAVASFNVEAFSLGRLQTLTLDEIKARYEEFAKLTEFTPIQL